MDDVEPFAGILDVRRQDGKHRRNLVAERTRARRGTDRYRDHRDQRLLPQPGAAGEPARARARAHRYEEVVARTPERVLDLLDGVKAHAADRDPPVLSDGPVERRGRRAAERRRNDLAISAV